MQPLKRNGNKSVGVISGTSCHRKRNRAHLLMALHFLLFGISCNEAQKAQRIIDRTREVHGCDLVEQARIEFDFRDRHYIAERNGGEYSYHRIFHDSLGEYHDILTNQGFFRRLNGLALEITKERANAYSNSVNSVIYFALLPYALNDPAVNKEYLGETEMNGKAYYKIGITFEREGGGEDHDDVFIYWIEKETFTMDFLAYTYSSDGGGIRFRKAMNPRMVKGIRFADYINMVPEKDTVHLGEIESAYRAGGLKKLSEIKLDNIEVEFP